MREYYEHIEESILSYAICLFTNSSDLNNNQLIKETESIQELINPIFLN